MIKVYRSETGQYVLVHPPTQTFIIDENLQAAYDKLLKHVEAKHSDAAKTVLDASEPAPAPRLEGRGARIAQLFLICFLALLPFVWLAVFQNSMAALMSDFLGKLPQPAAASAGVETFREDMDALRYEQNRMLEALHGFNQRLLDVEGKMNVVHTAPGGPAGAPKALDQPTDESVASPENTAPAPAADTSAPLPSEPVSPPQ